MAEDDPRNSLSDHCGVFHQLEDMQTFANVFCDNVWGNKSCVRLGPFALLTAEVLQYLCTDLVCSWVGMFLVVILLLSFLCVCFHLFKKFLSLGCDFLKF